MNVVGAEHQVQVRELLEKLLAFLLGDTASHAENEFRIAVFKGFEATQVAVGLAYRFIANSTGVQQDQAGLVGLFDLPVTDAAEQVDNSFRINHIHLAAKGLQIKSFIIHRVMSWPI